MPERRSARSERSSSVIDIVIGILLGVSLGVGLPERLIFGRWRGCGIRFAARFGAGSLGLGGLTFQRALERGVGEAVRLEQPRAHRLDVGARVVASQIREAVERPVAGAPEAREEFTRQGGRVRVRSVPPWRAVARVSREGLKRRSVCSMTNLPLAAALSCRRSTWPAASRISMACSKMRTVTSLYGAAGSAA